MSTGYVGLNTRVGTILKIASKHLDFIGMPHIYIRNIICARRASTKAVSLYHITVEVRMQFSKEYTTPRSDTKFSSHQINFKQELS